MKRFMIVTLTAGLLMAGYRTVAVTGAEFRDLFNGRDLTGWVNVNTAEDTWRVKDGLLVCSGRPIGVMRSEKQYENFVLHIEWMHIEPGGNSGVFVWSNAEPGSRESRLPDGVEVQMLELDWPKLNTRDGACRRSPTCTASCSASAASRPCPTTRAASAACRSRTAPRDAASGTPTTSSPWTA